MQRRPASLCRGLAAVAAAAQHDGRATPLWRSGTPTASTPTNPALEAAASSAYVHLPFCKRKCFYCDFPVEAVGGRLASQRLLERMRSYVDLLLREVAATPSSVGAHLQTVYFGGGTPSLVPPEQLARILQALDQRYGIASDAEVSMEADPGTFDLPRLRQYLALGVTRLSVGVQSFQQELLTRCGRAHTLEDVHRALDTVRGSGVRSWSLDLISGLPHLTRDMWRASLEQAVRAEPSHVSVYDLQVEEGTPFARWYSPGTKPLPEDEEAAAMYRDASCILRSAGFEHYEISNYARPGYRSRHNQVYWAGGPYLAFGLGAASYLGGRRFSRPGQMKGYEEWVQRSEALVTRPGAAGAMVWIPGAETPPQSLEERMLDTVMLRLRTADGLDMQEFASRYGADMAARTLRALRKHAAAGLVLAEGPQHAQHAASSDSGAATAEVGAVQHAQHAVGAEAQQLAAAQGRVPLKFAARVRLSDPDGFLLSNEVISDVFATLSSM